MTNLNLSKRTVFHAAERPQIPAEAVALAPPPAPHAVDPPCKERTGNEVPS